MTPDQTSTAFFGRRQDDFGALGTRAHVPELRVGENSLREPTVPAAHNSLSKQPCSVHITTRARGAKLGVAQWTTTPGTRATRPDTKLPTPARVTTVALPSEKRPEQNSRTWRRTMSGFSFCQRCCRMWQPRRSPDALFRQPSSSLRTGAPHVTGAWEKHHPAVAAERTTTTTGPAAELIHAAINRSPARQSTTAPVRQALLPLPPKMPRGNLRLGRRSYAGTTLQWPDGCPSRRVPVRRALPRSGRGHRCTSHLGSHSVRIAQL